MNDRYLYRAKRKDWRELPKEMWWVEGYYAFIDNHYYIYTGNLCNGGLYVVAERFEIDIATLCACTGLKDKNGKLIWENDICIINGSGIDDEDGYFVLEWEKSTARFAFDGCCCVDFDNVYGYECEVVGNIFDNPELLEVGE